MICLHGGRAFPSDIAMSFVQVKSEYGIRQPPSRTPSADPGQHQKHESHPLDWRRPEENTPAFYYEDQLLFKLALLALGSALLNFGWTILRHFETMGIIVC